MKITIEKAQKLMEENGGNLDLRGTNITALPDNLTVGGWLDLSGTNITALPDNLTVGGNLDLSGTNITALPDNLTVGGWLDLSGTNITALPDNLTVGGNLDLRGTNITALPDNLTVGGWLDLSGTRITAKERRKVKKLFNGTFKLGAYIYCDGILTHIRKIKTVDGYTLYVGKIPGKNVVTDGTNYAHCKNLREGIADLAFKTARDRGADQYRGMSLDTELTVADAMTMYRIITGACRQGTEHFVNSQRVLKDKYTVRELIEATKGQYNADKFASFFEVEA